MAIHDSAKSLEATMKKLLKGFTGDCNQVCREVFFDMGKRIIETTPVDTGRARKGWVPTNDSPSNDKPEPSTYADMQSALPSIPSDPFKDEASSWWWANNVEYIMDLEGGWSRQAPSGMVANAIDAINNHLKQALAKVKFK
jgi:hypothetical protein